MRQYETYKCQKCGNEVEVQNVGGGKLSCCGEENEMYHYRFNCSKFDESFCGRIYGEKQIRFIC
ncbi:desulfoferrodoxin FeS4 iron-binding domain-containing protein [Campylobacter jejuni]|nr:desulfoferrodoxin FeS4 iron-binding domain-containing protein [Campylobacter jejuni]EAI9265156.1 desulfoferrodoxin FeS4 iron-binding domain-containing protein [Campylobacter jejuni]EAK4179985.1 desulfoferrodoxin FeS4 iron-binding domain-containing protein [Campylobacter jejuni]